MIHLARNLFLIIRKAGIHCEIIPRASKYSDFQEKRWWKHRESVIAVASEYVKLVFSR